jgi:hypothetical protein
VDSCNELDGDGGAIEGDDIDFTNYSTSHTYGPGQYVVKAGVSGDPGSSSIIARITTSCCTGDSVTLVDMTITGASGGDNACALVTLSEDGSCMVELLPEPCPCP